MPIKAVLFDFMGTCLDWHSSVVSALPPSIPEAIRSRFALEWRQMYFDANTAKIHQGLPVEDIDITHANTLEQMIQQDNYSNYQTLFTSPVKQHCIQIWHEQRAWPEVGAAIERLKAQGLEVFVHANGTTRLQLDICRSSGLKFDMLLSSELLGVYKPALANYQKALGLLKRKPEECIMVAAHEYDLAGARAAGMKTIYVYRWTDDINEDQSIIKQSNDAYLESMDGLDEVVANL